MAKGNPQAYWWFNTARVSETERVWAIDIFYGLRYSPAYRDDKPIG
jgi:hypothetical protein